MRWCRRYIIWYHCVEISTAQWSVESSQTAAVHLGNHPDVCLCRGLSVFVRVLDSDYKERHTGSNRRPIRAMRVQVAGIWDACQPAETPELDTNHPSFMHSEKKPAAFCFLFVFLFFTNLITFLLNRKNLGGCTSTAPLIVSCFVFVSFFLLFKFCFMIC